MVSPSNKRAKRSSGPASSANDRRPAPKTVPGPGAPRKADPLKTLMPSGEVGSRNPPKVRTATASGGTSGAEDSTRAAGYVVDLAKTNDPPPGPPPRRDPALFKGGQPAPGASAGPIPTKPARGAGRSGREVKVRDRRGR